MSRYKFTLSLIVAWTTAAPLAVRAQDIDIAGTLYSQGVQAFFDGNSTAADSYLSRSIALNPVDPRTFYFRSLSRLRQGRQTEARADMQTGANLEAQRPNRFEIGKSLQRVQGQARLLLEQYRIDARLNAATTIKPKPTTVPDAAVLRERRVVPLEEFLQPGTPHSVAAPIAAPANPSSPAAAAAKPAEQPTFAPAAGANPFGDDAAPETAPQAPPAKVAPAKAPPAKAPEPAAPKSPPPSEKQSPAKDDNPFG